MILFQIRKRIKGKGDNKKKKKKERKQFFSLLLARGKLS